MSKDLEFQVGDTVICNNDEIADYILYDLRERNCRKLAGIKKGDKLVISDITSESDGVVLYFKGFRYWHSAQFFDLHTRFLKS